MDQTEALSALAAKNAAEAQLARACNCDVKRQWDATSSPALPTALSLSIVYFLVIFHSNHPPNFVHMGQERPIFVIFYFSL